MKLAQLLLCLAALPIAAQDPSELSWSSDLDQACAKASKEGKLVLLRQIVCDCAAKECLYAGVAKAPWFCEDRETRRLVEQRFVAVAVHVLPAKMDEGLVDPGFPPSGDGPRLRTLFLTPGLNVLHRLDLCPHSGDVRSEVQFVLKIAEECYDSAGAAREGGDRKFIDLHREHESKPKAWHKEGAGACGTECGCKPPDETGSASKKPWGGYRRGILWHTDLEEAKSIAGKSHKLILYYQIVGALNKEGC
jgi:hypothetical protein